MNFLVTTTGTVPTVTFIDLGERSLTHPEVDVDFSLEYSFQDLIDSADLQAAIDAGEVTVTDGNGNSISDIAGQLTTQLTIQKDDVDVATPADTLNFEGAGVSVADEGGGKATVTIPDTSYTHPNHTGDVASVGDGATTIQPDVVDNTKLANMAASSIKGNDTGGAADPKDLTVLETLALLDVYTTTQVDALIDASLKVPEAYDPAGSGNFPTTYDGNPVTKGDTFRIVTADTLGSGTVVNPEDLLIALVDTPGQTDSNWQVVESNRDQATETVKGVAEIATQAEVNTGTDDERIITPAKLAGSTLASDVATNNAKVSNATHTGDVTGSTALTISADAVDNTKLANMPAFTIKGNDTAGVTDPQDLTAAEVRTLLNIADGANNYVHPNHTGDVTSVGDGVTTISNNAVTNTKLSDMPALTIKGNDTGGAADPQDLTAAEVRILLNVADGANNYTHPNHTGDVTSVGDGVTTISADAVDNTKLANMAANRLKGRATAGVGDPEDLQISALTEELTPAAGDWLLAEDALGNLVKVDVGNLPGGVGGSVNSVTGGVNITNSGTAADPILDHDAHTGDVTGATALTIAADAVTNAKLANMPANSFKANNTAAFGDPVDVTVSEDTIVGRLTGGNIAALTPTQVRTLLNVADGANNYVHPNHSGDVVSLGDGTTFISNDVVSNAKLTEMPANTIKGNDTAGSANPQDLSPTEVRTLLNVADGANNYVHPNHSGDVTSVADGATTIQPNVVTNAKLADMASGTIKARATAGSGDPEDILISGLTEELTPASGDWLLGEDSVGNLIKIDPTNLPSSGGVATDPIWDVQGDLVVATGPDAATRIPIGSAGSFLRSDSITAAWSTVTFPNAANAGDILYASGLNNYDNLAAGANTEVLTIVGGVPTWQAPSNYVHPNHTGDVTSVGDGAQTIQPDVVDNTKLANMPANTFKGNNTGVSADPLDLSISDMQDALGIISLDALGLANARSQENMVVLRNTNGTVGTWTDITTPLLDGGAGAQPLFDTGAINNALYVGADEFPNAIGYVLSTAMVLGAGTVDLQYWDGTVWFTLAKMENDASNLISNGDSYFESVGTFHLRNSEPGDAALLTLDGNNKYWIRCIVTAAITTVPVADNLNWFTDGIYNTEYFGDYQRLAILNVYEFQDVTSRLVGNTDVPAGPNTGINKQNNLLNNNAYDSFGVIVRVPEDINTAEHITTVLSYIPDSNNVNNWEGRMALAIVQDGAVADGTLPEQTVSTVIPLDGTANLVKRYQETFDLEASALGDDLQFAIGRDATGGNLNDLYTGGIAARVFSIAYKRWK